MGNIEFTYLFEDLSGDDEADFMHALVPDNDGNLNARLAVTYGDPDSVGRLKVRKWSGAHNDVFKEPAADIARHSDGGWLLFDSC